MFSDKKRAVPSGADLIINAPAAAKLLPVCFVLEEKHSAVILLLSAVA